LALGSGWCAKALGRLLLVVAIVAIRHELFQAADATFDLEDLAYLIQQSTILLAIWT